MNASISRVYAHNPGAQVWQQDFLLLGLRRPVFPV
jgi:hypothetical protein